MNKKWGFLVIAVCLCVFLVSSSVSKNTFSDLSSEGVINLSENVTETKYISLPLGAEVVNAGIKLSFSNTSNVYNISLSNLSIYDVPSSSFEHIVPMTNLDFSGGPTKADSEIIGVETNVNDSNQSTSYIRNNCGLTWYWDDEDMTVDIGHSADEVSNVYFYVNGSYSYGCLTDGNPNYVGTYKGNLIGNCDTLSISDAFCYLNQTNGTTRITTVDDSGECNLLKLPIGDDGISESGDISINSQLYSTIYMNTTVYETWVSYTSPVKDINLTESLNLALNNGGCDCDGCIAHAKYCEVPLNFYSLVGGNISYSEISIVYESSPFFTSINFNDSQWFGSSIGSLIYEVSDGLNLSNLTFIVEDLENNLIKNVSIDISLDSIESYNYTYPLSEFEDGSYNATFSINNSQNKMVTDNRVFYLDTTYPKVNYSLESNRGDYYNKNSIFVDLLVYELNPSFINLTIFKGASLVDYYYKDSSFTSGDILINNTFSSLVQGDYTYNATICDIVGKCNSTENLNVTLLNPSMNSSLRSMDIVLGNTISIDYNFSEGVVSSEYTVKDSSGDINNNLQDETLNVSGNNFIFSVTNYSNYIITINMEDSNGWTSEKNITFTTKIASGGSVTTGSKTVNILGEQEWEMYLINEDIVLYEKRRPKNTETDLMITFKNTGDSERTLDMVCQDLEGDGCKFVSFPEEGFILPEAKDIEVVKYFSITTDDEVGEYRFNIVAIDDTLLAEAITVNLEVGNLGALAILYKLGLKSPTGIPYALVFFFTLGLSIFLLVKLAKVQGVWSFLIALVLAGLSIGFW